MPKYVQQKGLGFLASSFILFICLLIIGWVFWENQGVFLLFLILVVYTFFHTKKQQRKFFKLANERKDNNIGTFTKSFDYRNIDTWIIRAVYEQLQEDLPFPILANDHLFNDLEMDEEYIMDIMNEIAQRTGITLDNIEKNSYYQKLNTVSDLVYFFQNQSLKKG